MTLLVMRRVHTDEFQTPYFFFVTSLAKLIVLRPVQK